MTTPSFKPSIFSPSAPRWLHLSAALLLAAVVRLGLLIADVIPFNADEAVVGLMARHILQGQLPVFFYGQAYLGSLDAILVAGAMAVIGPSVWAIRLVQIALFLGTVATTYLLGLRIYRSQWIAGAAAAFMALPPVLVSLYTTASLGGYGEVLLLGNLMLLLALRLGSARPGAPGSLATGALGGWLLLGLFMGLGVWTFPLSLVYTVPVLVYLAIAGRRAPRMLAVRVALLVAGGLLGAAPWLVYTLNHGWITVAEAGGAAISGVALIHPVLAVFRNLGFFLLFGLTVLWGARPPWSAQWLALPMLPYLLAMQFGALVFVTGRLLFRRGPSSGGRWLLAGVCFTVVGGFIFSPFGADPSGRYFLPMSVPLALFLAEMLHWLRLRRRRMAGHPWRKWFAQLLALGMLLNFWWGTVESAAHMPPGITTQFSNSGQVDQRDLPQLIDFLRTNGETRGYANYWVSYPLAFESDEELIFVPSLPYHLDMRYTTRDNRYAPYAQVVADSPRAAYITTRHAALDALLRTGLARLEVTHQEAQFGDYHVFYDLSRKVTPDELGLGQDCCPPAR